MMNEADILEAFTSSLEEHELKFLSESDKRRFCRARKWVVADAVKMAKKWASWWQLPIHDAVNLTPETVLHPIIDPKEDLHVRLCPLAHMGEDKLGHPIYWEQSGRISGSYPELATHLTQGEMIARHIRHQEMAMCRLFHASTRHNREIEKQVVVMNLKDMVYHLDTRALTTFRAVLAVDEAYYPERLQHFFVINAPWFFTAIWMVVKPWIDETTREKFQILGSDYLPVLLRYIDEKQIPVELGGSHEGFVWQWPYPEESGCSPSQIQDYLKRRSETHGENVRSVQGAEAETKRNEHFL